MRTLTPHPAAVDSPSFSDVLVGCSKVLRHNSRYYGGLNSGLWLYSARKNPQFLAGWQSSPPKIKYHANIARYGVRRNSAERKPMRFSSIGRESASQARWQTVNAWRSALMI